MKRWDADNMLEMGKKLFVKIHRQKKHASPNHDVHFMAREIDEWLPQGIQAMIDGTYDPRCIKRIYFPDEVVDYLPTQPKGNSTATYANDDCIDQPAVNSLTMRGGVKQFLIIKSMSLCKLFRMQGHCERHAGMLNQWSPMESLSERSEVICSAGLRGGKTLHSPGITRKFYSALLMFVGMRPHAIMQLVSFNLTS